MSVRKDADGRRSVEVEVEVTGTPEEVWRAIATGPGMSSWFVPTRVEEREGGAITFELAPGVEAPATVTGWEPPRRLAYEERDWAPGAPPVATEVLVETRGSGRCVVRIVHSLFASGEDWDDQLESFESGWPAYFGVLQLYLAEFSGLPCATLQAAAQASGSVAEAWEALARPLGLAGAKVGARCEAGPGAPPFAGRVEEIATGDAVCHALVRLERPAPGAACVSAYAWDGVQTSATLYLYGEGGADGVAREQPTWRAWMQERPRAADGAGVL